MLKNIFSKTRKQTESQPKAKHSAKKRSLMAFMKNLFIGDGDVDTAMVFMHTEVNAIIQNCLPIWRNESRVLSRTNPTARSYLGLLEANVIGKEGFTLQLEIKNNDGTINTDLSNQIETEWKAWSKAVTPDGKMNLAQFSRLALRTEAVDGEAIIYLINSPKADKVNPYNFSIKLLNSAWLDHTYSQADTGNGYISLGIEKDTYDRPIKYYFTTDTKNKIKIDGLDLEFRKGIDAKSIIHKFTIEEVGQSRGTPWFNPIAQDLKNFKGYVSAVVVNERVAASKMGFFTKKEDSLDSDAEDTSIETIKVSPGSLTELPTNYDFKDWNPTSGNANFSEVTSTLLRQVAASLNVSYNVLAGDLTNVNYSSIRAGMLSERDSWRILQADHVQSVLVPIFKEWLIQADLSGKISIPQGVTIQKIVESARWIGRGWDWVDPLKDIQAILLGVNGGLITRTKALAEKGENYEDVLKQISEEQELAKQLGVVLTTQPTQKPTTGNTDASNQDNTDATGVQNESTTQTQ